MSTFFERNKRKGTLAALLLLLRRGKGVVALLVLVAVLSGVFVLPGGMRVPWADKALVKMGFATRSGDFSGMTRAMRSARQDDQDWTIGGLGRRLIGRSLYTPNASSSMELVLKKVERKDNASSSVGSPQSVSGVMRPEDVGKGGAVELTRDEFLGGLVRSANAAAMASGGPMADGGKLADGGQMAQNLEMASASNPGDGLLGHALAFASVPGAGAASELPKKAAGGKIDKLRSYSIGQSLMNFYGEDPQRSGKKTFYGLAEARAYSVTAAQPLCADSNNCPKEYAANTAGLVFDGGTSHADVMSNTELGETSSPNVPDQKSIKPIVDESKQYYDDVQDCDAVDQWAQGGGALSQSVKNANAQPYKGKTMQEMCQAQWSQVTDQTFITPQTPFSERVLMDEMQHQSCKMNCNLNDIPHHPECTKWAGTACRSCDSGSCDRDTAKACKEYGAQMKAVCNVLNCVFHLKHTACPLAQGQPEDKHSCDQ